MDREWIDQLSTTRARKAQDALERAVQYGAVAGPRWQGIKVDVMALIDAYNSHADTRHPVLVEDAGHRLVVRGQDHALNITFHEDKARIVGYYRSRKQRRRREQYVGLRLDMRADGLMVLDRRGCPVDDPARLLLEPFFRSLRDAERPTYWERPGVRFPR